MSHVFKDIDSQKAIEYFGEFLSLSNKSENRFPKEWIEGMSAMEKGNFKETIRIFENLSINDDPFVIPILPQIFVNLGIAYIQMGNVSNMLRCMIPIIHDFTICFV